MARTKGMLNLSGNLEVNAGAPLDARSVVPTLADLTTASNFQYKYIGMTVTVQATGDMYTLLTNDVTDITNWKKVGSGGGSSYTAGDGIDITNDEISVKAGSNLSFDSSGNLNATDTTYTAGTNVSISNQNVISATDTTYTAGTGIDITNNVISATGGGGTSYTAGDGIDITNNVISIDEMASADMDEIITPLPSVQARLHTYSEDEQVVAYIEKTVNGVKVKKPVYEKTFFHLKTPTVATEGTNVTVEYDEIVSALNIEYIKSLDFYCEEKFVYGSPIYMVNSQPYKLKAYVSDSSNKISLASNSNNFNNIYVNVIIQYTKTTD